DSAGSGLRTDRTWESQVVTLKSPCVRRPWSGRRCSACPWVRSAGGEPPPRQPGNAEPLGHHEQFARSETHIALAHPNRDSPAQDQAEVIGAFVLMPAELTF